MQVKQQGISDTQRDLTEKQARLAEVGLRATCNELASDQPAATKGKSSPRYCVLVDTWCAQYLLCTVTAQVVASNITVVDATTCEVATALLGNTVALEAVPASDRTLLMRGQKMCQPDSETPAVAALVMPSLLQQVCNKCALLYH